MKKKAIGIGIMTVTCICIFLLTVKINQTPYEYLKKNGGSSSVTSVNELLYQANIGDKEYALFYINGKNSLSCAIIKKTIFSYSILKISSEVSFLNDSERADFIFSSYNKGHNWIYWGIVRDDKIKQVIINDRKANLADIDAYSFRISYLLGDKTEKTIPPEHKLLN